MLVGFMGSGKSTVGRLLARRLGWVFVDLDEAVEAATGIKVAELFRTRGEAAFRQLEAEAGVAAAARAQVVIAPGGGWSLVPDRLDGLPEGSLTVWLRVRPETAARRATGTRRCGLYSRDRNRLPEPGSFSGNGSPLIVVLGCSCTPTAPPLLP